MDAENFVAEYQRKIKSRIEVDPETGCWIWSWSKLASGYGRVSVLREGKYKIEYPHRLAYELWVGPIPDGFVVMHTVCDNPSCCNPEHLKAGTQSENISAMHAKGRRASVGKKQYCDRCKAELVALGWHVN